MLFLFFFEIHIQTKIKNKKENLKKYECREKKIKINLFKHVEETREKLFG